MDDQFKEQTFILVIAYMKRREVGTFANIKINVHSMREKDDKVEEDKRVKWFNYVEYK